MHCYYCWRTFLFGLNGGKTGLLSGTEYVVLGEDL